jgi:hypothetical protein
LLHFRARVGPGNVFNVLGRVIDEMKKEKVPEAKVNQFCLSVVGPSRILAVGREVRLDRHAGALGIVRHRLHSVKIPPGASPWSPMGNRQRFKG